jgi:hypothetical protein
MTKPQIIIDLYNFELFVSHASQGYLTCRNLDRVTRHLAN